MEEESGEGRGRERKICKLRFNFKWDKVPVPFPLEECGFYGLDTVLLSIEWAGESYGIITIVIILCNLLFIPFIYYYYNSGIYDKITVHLWLRGHCL